MPSIAREASKSARPSESIAIANPEEVKYRQKSSRIPLPESVSLLLDVLRFSAALAVVADHFTIDAFHLGYANREIWGNVAVPVFFVLSGFVIRFTTRTRETTMRDYFISRASRIYSVALPAMVFTVLVIGLCLLIDHGRFQRDWTDRLTHPAIRVLTNLTFTSQIWGHDTTPLINIPFWSLGYECIYYLGYGAIFFLRGWKRVLVGAGIAVAVGPQILLLAPIWWLGCWLYDFYLWCRGGCVARIILIAAASWLVVGIVLHFAGHGMLLLLPLKAFLMIANARNPIGLMGMWPAKATMFAVATGIFTAVFLLPLLLAVEHLEISRSHPWAVKFRTVANATFVIYLLHFPFLVLLLFVGVLRPMHYIGNFILGIMMCIALVALARPIDALKEAIRALLLAYLQPRRRLGSHDD